MRNLLLWIVVAFVLLASAGLSIWLAVKTGNPCGWHKHLSHGMCIYNF